VESLLAQLQLGLLVELVADNAQLLTRAEVSSAGLTRLPGQISVAYTCAVAGDGVVESLCLPCLA
jgi:hypothetical protein